MNFEFWAHYLRHEVLKIEHFSADAAKELEQLIGFLPQIPHALPTEGGCPYCEAKYLLGHWDPDKRGAIEHVVHTMRVVQWLKPCDRNYQAGYRAIWKCTNPACGETEMR